MFTPNDYPALTYVERGSAQLERELRQALETPNVVVSISGPSKSGKTVLAERIVGPENIVAVSGAEIYSGSDLWNRILDILDQPTSIALSQNHTTTTGGSGEIGGRGGLPFVAEASGKVTAQHSRASISGQTSTTVRRGLSQAEAILAESQSVVFIDDFHYMDRPVQSAVAQQIRAGSGRGIKFVVASVPHRSDDVVRSNHELRGRTAQINTSFWLVDDLAAIGVQGFPQLLMRVPDEEVRSLAVEACGSPQLMQQICLQASIHLGVATKLDRLTEFSISGAIRRQVLKSAATHTDYTSLVRDMHAGPRTRGTSRTQHQLIDGSKGDVYRAVLLGIAKDPPLADISYSDLVERTHSVCVGSQPTGQGIGAALEQMAIAARKMYPDQRIIEWDPTAAGGTLSLVDPYLLFFIRNSGKLASLAA